MDKELAFALRLQSERRGKGRRQSEEVPLGGSMGRRLRPRLEVGDEDPARGADSGLKC